MEQIDWILKNAIVETEHLQQVSEKAGVYHISFSGTSNYLEHIGIAAFSILQSNPGRKFHFHLFINGISQNDKKRFMAMAKQMHCGITLYYVDDTVFQDMLQNDGIAAFFYRFLIPPTVAVEGIAKILYLDGDMMCQGDISPLMELNIEDYIAACVEDTSPEVAAECKKRVGTKEYFNSGVMLINVLNWNRKQVSQKAAQKAVERRKQAGKKLPGHDQDILNVLLDGKFKMVEQKYNWIYNLEVRGILKKQNPLDFDENAVLVHFAAYVKPWRSWVQEAAGVKKYNSYRDASPWKDSQIIGLKTTKDIHQAARYARATGNYGNAIKLYCKYYLKKLMLGK